MIFRFIDSAEALQNKKYHACSRIDPESGCAAESVVEFSHQISEMVSIGNTEANIRGRTSQYFEYVFGFCIPRVWEDQIKII